jgi:3-hydroxyisobutyrate dehydrogenase-like beta-hydroxyacid dehydrogenase
VLIGFAGLGRMGGPMAANLARAGHAVLGYDPVAAPPEGVRRAASVRELAGAALTVSMLPDAATTGELLDALLPAAAPGHRHVVMGTVGPDAVRVLAERAREHGVLVVDAPVSGSVTLAAAAQITTMVGATAAAFAAVRPVLAAMTREQHHTGPVGSGQAAKLAVNAVLAALNQAVAEGLLLAEAGGLDGHVFYDVLRTSAAGAPFVAYKEEAFLAPERAPVAAPVSLIRKDVRLALDLARAAHLALPGAQAVAAVLDDAVAAGLGERDMAHVLTALRTPERIRR